MRSRSPARGLGIAGALLLTAVLLALAIPGCRRRDTAPAGAATNGVAAPPPVVLVPATNMVPIRAGAFTRIRQPVTLSHDYWIGKYEVTQAEYSSLMVTNPSRFLGDPNRPVEKLTYHDAAAYCAALTARERAAGRLPTGYAYRLPTEAEWEYACRAGTTNLFSFGDDAALAVDFAWTLENSESATHPVGSKRPNPWGLHDMHGNVWEWCLDWFAPYPESAAVDPAGPAGSRFKVFRGGGWNQEIQYARSANRFMMSPTNGIHFVGFRVVLSPLTPRVGP